MKRRFSKVSYDEKKETIPQCRSDLVFFGRKRQSSRYPVQALDLYSEKVLTRLDLHAEIIPASKTRGVVHSVLFKLRKTGSN